MKMNIFYKKEINYFINRFINDNHFKYSRFNDGEMIALSGKKPNGVNCDGHRYFSEMGIELKNVLLNYEKNPNYIIESYDYWYNISDNIKNIIHDLINENIDLTFLNEDFIRIAHERESEKFIEILNIIKEKNVVIIGPEYLKDLNTFFNFRYIDIPLKNCYLIKDKIINDISKISIIENDVYFLFSASMATNVIIDHFKNDNRNTYLDWGSVWDTFFISDKYSYIRKRSTSTHEKYKEIYKKYLL